MTIGSARNGIYRLLRWSEKYTKTDMVYLAKGGGWMLFGRAVGMAATFFLSLALANLLPKETFGQYKYVISIANVLSLFTLSGMGTAVARAVAQGREGVIDVAVRAEIRWGTIGGLLSATLGVFYYFGRHDIGLALAFFVLAIFAPFINVYSLYSSILQGKKLFPLSVRYDVYSQIINFALMLVAILQTRQVWLLILPFLFVNSWLQKIWLARTRAQVGLNSVSDDETIKFGKDLSWMGAFNIFSTYFDQIAVFYFLGPVQTAIYSMALAPTEQMKGVFKIVGAQALPKFAGQPLDASRKEILDKSIKFGLSILVIILVYIVLAPWLYAFLFPAYGESVKYSQLFALSLVATASMLPMNMLQGQKQTSALYKWNVSSAIVSIVSILLGGYFYGLWGVVIARTVSRFFDLIYLMVLAKQSK